MKGHSPDLDEAVMLEGFTLLPALMRRAPADRRKSRRRSASLFEALVAQPTARLAAADRCCRPECHVPVPPRLIVLFPGLIDVRLPRVLSHQNRIGLFRFLCHVKLLKQSRVLRRYSLKRQSGATRPNKGRVRTATRPRSWNLLRGAATTLNPNERGGMEEIGDPEPATKP